MPTEFGRIKKKTCTVCGKSYAPGSGGPFDTCPFHKKISTMELVQVRVNQWVKKLLTRIKS